MQQLIHAALARTQWGERTQNTVGIGYSCVVFALMTWASLHERGATLDLFFMRIPFNISPFVSLVVTQMIIPNVDFVGHLAGIFAGNVCVYVFWRVMYVYVFMCFGGYHACYTVCAFWRVMYVFACFGG